MELDCKELEKSVACDIPARIKSQYEKLQLLQCWASEQQIASFLFTGHIQQAASFSHQVCFHIVFLHLYHIECECIL